MTFSGLTLMMLQAKCATMELRYLVAPGLRLMHLDVRAQGLPTLVLLVPTRKPKCLGPRGYEPRDDFSYLLTVWVVSFLILGHRDHGLGPRDQDTCWYRVGLRF